MAHYTWTGSKTSPERKLARERALEGRLVLHAIVPGLRDSSDRGHHSGNIGTEVATVSACVLVGTAGKQVIVATVAVVVIHELHDVGVWPGTDFVLATSMEER